MKRREFASILLVGALGTAGCVETDSQPNSVPIWIENLTDQPLTVSVVCTERGTDETLISTEAKVEPDGEQSFYADPISADGTYVVSIGIDGRSEEATVSGGGVRSIDVEIRAADRIQITPVTT